MAINKQSEHKWSKCTYTTDDVMAVVNKNDELEVIGFGGFNTRRQYVQKYEVFEEELAAGKDTVTAEQWQDPDWIDAMFSKIAAENGAKLISTTITYTVTRGDEPEKGEQL